MPATFTIPSIFTAVDRFSGPMKAMGNAVHGFASKATIQVARAERAFRSLLSPIMGLRNMLNNIGYYIGIYTFIRAMRDAYNVVADFEQAQIDISAVTGKSVKENAALANQARMMALRYGEAAASISALQLSLIKLGYSESQVLKMTEPVLTASIALKGVPDEVAKKMGAILQAFKIPANDTQQVADLLAKAADLSALDWSDLSTMLPTAMQSAALAWNDVAPLEQFKRLLALFATVRNAQVHVASGATGIKNMLVDAGIRGKDYQELIQRIIDSPNELKKAYKLFGRRTLVSALPIAEAQKMGSIEDFITQLSGPAAQGYALQVASKRLDSLRGNAKLLGAAYDELILSIDNGSGPIGTALKQFFTVGRTMLYLASGSDAAKDALTSVDSATISSAENWLMLTKAVLTIIKWFIIFKVVLIAAKIALFAYNVALGIAVALGWKNVFALRGNSVALAVYAGAARIGAAATWLFNSALLAGVGTLALILGAIGLVATAVYLIIDNWNEWGAAVTLFLGPLGTAVSMLKSFYDHWDMVKKGFSVSFLDGIKAIGKVMFDSFLYPLQQMYSLLGKALPGTWGKDAQRMSELVQSYRKDLGVASVDENGKNIPDVKERLNLWREQEMAKNKGQMNGPQQNWTVDFKNAPQWLQISGDKKFTNIQPSVSSTHGAQTSW